MAYGVERLRKALNPDDVRGVDRLRKMLGSYEVQEADNTLTVHPAAQRREETQNPSVTRQELSLQIGALTSDPNTFDNPAALDALSRLKEQESALIIKGENTGKAGFLQNITDNIWKGTKDSATNFGNAMKSEMASNYDVKGNIANNPFLKNSKFAKTLIDMVDTAAKEDPKALQAQNRLAGKKETLISQVEESGEKMAREREALNQKYAHLPGWQRTAGELIGGVGQMAPVMTASVISPGVGMQYLYGSAAGSAATEALQSGADIQAATDAATISGAKEVAIEKLFGGIPLLGKGALSIEDLSKKFIKSKVGQTVVNRLFDAFGEGAEEVASALIEPFIKRYYYDPDAPMPTMEELVSAWGGGAVPSLVLGIPVDIKNAITSSRVSNVNATNAPSFTENAGQTGLPMVEDTITQNAAENAEFGQSISLKESNAMRTLTEAKNLERYNSEIDGAFTGDLPTGKEIVLGRTPEILQNYGASDNPLHMTQSTARKIAYPQGYVIGGKNMGGKHNLGMSVLKQLPYQLEDPIAIIDDKQVNQYGLNSRIVLTQWHDEAGRPIIIPIHIDKQGAISLQNEVASAFQAESEYFKNLLGKNQENVLYTKNNEDINRLLSQGQIAPKAMADDVFIKHNISNQFDNVKDGGKHTVGAADNTRKSTTAHAGYQGTPATDKLGIKIEKPIAELGASRSIVSYEKAAYETRKALEQEIRKLSPTDAEKTFAKGIAEGIYAPSDIPKSMKKSTVEALSDYYKAVNAFKDGGAKGQKERNYFVFDGKVEKLLKNSDAHQTPSASFLNHNTMQRNNLKIFGQAEGKAINAELFDPIITNEAERLRFINRMFDRVREFNLTPRESELAQQVKEGKLKAENIMDKGVDRDKIQRAVKAYTEAYNDFYDAINDFLVAHGYKPIGFIKDYAPHMQPENTDAMARIFQRLGFSDTVSELPTEIAGRTENFKPGKQYNPYFQERLGDKTKFDLVGGYESYVNYLSNVLYHTDDIQKLRRYNNALRYKYSSEEIKAEISRIKAIENADEEIKQAMLDEAYERGKNILKYGSYVSALDEYTNTLAGKQATTDRGVEKKHGREKLNLGNKLNSIFVKSTILGNLSSAINQTVQLPQVNAEVKSKYVLQAMKDIATGELTKTEFKKQSDFLTGKQGVKALKKARGLDKVYDVAAIPFEVVDDLTSQIIVRSKYLSELNNGKSHEDALKSADNFANKIVGSRMKGAKPNAFNEKNIFSKLYTTFQLEVANGWAHITQDLPAEIQNTAKTQGKTAAVKRTAILMTKATIGAFVLNNLIEMATGNRPVPYDIIGIIINMLKAGSGDDEDDEFDVGAAAKSLGQDVVNEIPYASNLMTLAGYGNGRLPLPQVWNDQIARGWNRIWTDSEEDNSDEIRKQGWNEFLGGVGLSAASLLPMGNQIRKTVQGINAWNEGGHYTGYGDGKKLQYPVEKSLPNLARGALFGRSSFPEAGEKYDYNKSALSPSLTRLYDAAIEYGIDAKNTYNTIYQMQGLKTIKNSDGSTNKSIVDQRKEIIRNSNLSQLEKVYLRMQMLEETQREKADELRSYGVTDKLFIDILDKYQEIDKKYDNVLGTLSERNRKKATSFQKYVDSLRLKPSTASAVTDNFIYWNMTPAESVAYRLGLMSEAAQKKFSRAQKVGFDEDEYVYFYPIFMQQKKKEEILKEAQEEGMDGLEAIQFWNIVKGNKTSGLPTLPTVK